MIKVAQFHLIKHCIEREGLSQRETTQKLGISRNTVKKYMKAQRLPTTILRKEVYGGRKLRSESEQVIPVIDRRMAQNRSKCVEETAAYRCQDL